MQPLRQIMRLLFVAGLLVVLLGACEQKASTPGKGFAGLGQDAAEFRQVVRGYQLEFPRDHGPHEGFRIEWWYITANLTDEQNRDWGVQWTLFRSALRPEPSDAAWFDANAWLGHVAITGPFGHRFDEAFARGGIGQAGVTTTPFHAWIDNWSLRSAGADGIQDVRLTVATEHFGYNLHLVSHGPLVLHGDHGYSEKSGQGQASYYYSQPFYRAVGEVEFEGKRYPVTGHAWMDREWSSQPLTAEQQGWDWFSLHFDTSKHDRQQGTGPKLMLFQVRQNDGQHYRAGTWIAADGQTTVLKPDQIQLAALERTPQHGRSVPTQWRLQLPDFKIDVVVSAVQPDAWMGTTFPYWEGPVTVSGSVSGRGYLEMTGY